MVVTTKYKKTNVSMLRIFGLFRVFSSYFVKRTCNRLAHIFAHLSLPNSDVMEDFELPIDFASII